MVYKELKEKAIKMLREGKAYSQILVEIPVAKSTLSLWLRSVGLSIPQKQKITELRRMAQKQGALARKQKRINLQKEIFARSESEIGTISIRELWLIGTALYWAEGTKEKEYDPGHPTSFSNSDPRMISLFLTWLERCVNVDKSRIICSIYIHESHRKNIEKVLDYWSKSTNIPASQFTKTYFKKIKVNTKRHNTGSLYYGLLRVTIRESSTLNRQITGWTRGIVKNCGIV